MARPSDISTKVISFRVPMKDYIKLLTLATDKGLSISDYMLMRVYGPDGEITKGKSLAGTEQEPAAGQESAHSLQAVIDPVPSEPKAENNLSGIPKEPRKQRSTQKASKATVNTKKVAQKPAKETKTAKRKEEQQRKQQQAKKQQEAKIREAEARKAQREELQQAIKNYQSEHKRYDKLAKEAKYRMENELTTAGTLARDKPQLESAEKNMASLEEKIAATKRELAQLR